MMMMKSNSLLMRWNRTLYLQSYTNWDINVLYAQFTGKCSEMSWTW